MTKQQLWRIRRELISAKILREELEQLKAGLLPGAIRYDKDRVQTSPDDHQADVMAQAVDMEREIGIRLWNIVNEYNKAYREIEALEDEREKQVMHLYFLNANGYRMNEIADILNYSQSQVYRFYESALRKLKDESK